MVDVEVDAEIEGEEIQKTEVPEVLDVDAKEWTNNMNSLQVLLRLGWACCIR